MKWITVVVLCYNEEKLILNCLQRIRELEGASGAEVIVSDGGSNDDTIDLISNEVDFIKSEPNKSIQMNKALALAKTDVLWFVHVDMNLPSNSLLLIKKHIQSGFDGGGFKNEFDRYNQKIKRIGTVSYTHLTLPTNREV